MKQVQNPVVFWGVTVVLGGCMAHDDAGHTQQEELMAPVSSDRAQLVESLSNCQSVAVSHINFFNRAYGPSLAIKYDEEKSLLAVECAYWVDTKDDESVAQEVVEACRSAVLGRCDSVGALPNNNQVAGSQLPKDAFQVTYVERSEEEEKDAPQFPNFTMYVRAQVDFAR